MVIQHLFSFEENYSPAVFPPSEELTLFCIYLVKLTSVVVNQGFVILPFLSELPAKIHNTEVLPVFPSHFAEGKQSRKTLQIGIESIHMYRSEGCVVSLSVGAFVSLAR